MNVTELKVGDRFRLESMDQDLDRDFRKDLLDYGFLPGTEMQIFEKYKSSEKIVVQISETRIAIRWKDAEKIYCQVLR